MRRTLLLPAELPDPGGLFIERQELTAEGWETKVFALAYGVITREQTSMLLTSVDLLDGNDPPCWAFLNLSIIYREPKDQLEVRQLVYSDQELARSCKCGHTFGKHGEVSPHRCIFCRECRAFEEALKRSPAPTGEEKDDDIPW